MRLMFTLLAAVACGFGLYHWQFADFDLSGTRWHCSSTKASFTSKAYQGYSSIEELTTMYFPTNGSVLYYQSGVLNHKSGLVEPFELVLSARNKIVGQRIEQKFMTVDWNLIPKSSPVFVRDKNSLADFELDLGFYVDGDKLFFFNPKGAEDLNIACHQI
ncbi:hypothetical protein [Vibrio sinaloensis]|nr:hypothetical protein [Vibrio sinaloensis]